MGAQYGKKRRRGKGRSKASQAAALNPMPDDLPYTFSSVVKTVLVKAPVYDVKFHLDLRPGEPPVFAVAVGNQIEIYKCEPEGSCTLLLCFAEQGDDIYYACSWGSDDHGRPVLAAAGLKGVVRVLAVASGKCTADLHGHTQAVNDVKFHPKMNDLLFSASKDHSIRLWNVVTSNLIAVFHGEEGHRDEVISLDVNLCGTRLLSGGMDHAIKIWNLNQKELEKKIALSRCFAISDESAFSFPTWRQHYPDVSTREIHGNYVDCVRWFGDLVISKACSNDEEDENEIIIWKPGPMSDSLAPHKNFKRSNDKSCPIWKLKVFKCQCWFMRFDIHLFSGTLAIGNEMGECYLFDLNSKDVTEVSRKVMKHGLCKKAIRQTTFSRDGSVLIFVTDDGKIWRWDRK